MRFSPSSDGTDDHDADEREDSELFEPVPEGMGTVTRIFAVVFILGAIAFWIFAFSPWARQIFQAPDQLADEVYVANIESTCASTVALLDALPSPRSAEGPEERANIVENSNVELVRMRENLASLEGGTAADRNLVARWLLDWDILIADRVTHVERLRTEGDVRFLNTEADGIFIAERMSGFARVNEFRSCLPPGDL